MELTKQNFRIYATKAYDNPFCLSEDEFESDLFRSSVIKKMLSKYQLTGTINIRLFMNSVVCFYNVFAHKEATNILRFKLVEESKPFLNSVLFYLNLPRIEENNIDEKFYRLIEAEFGVRHEKL